MQSPIATYPIRLALTAAASALAVLPASAQMEEIPYSSGLGNRIQLDNGGDALMLLNSPSHGTTTAPFIDGFVDGDHYWKCFPNSVLERCGDTKVRGIEYSVFDLDWNLSEELWGWILAPGETSSSGGCIPDYNAGLGVYIPPFSGALLGNPLGNGNCPPPGMIAGWSIQDVLYHSAGEPYCLEPDNDWTITHLFSEGMDVDFPTVNSCGESGDGTFSWYGSNELGADPARGENQVDIDGNGLSRYGGLGGWTGNGLPSLRENEWYDSGAEMALLLEGPTINGYSETGQGLGAGLGYELGLANLQLGVGFTSSGTTVGTGAELGLKMFDQEAEVGDFFIAAGNIGITYLDQGFCLPFLGGQTALNISDPAFLPLLFGFGFGVFDVEAPGQNMGKDYGADLHGEMVAETQFPFTSFSQGLIGLDLKLQGWRVSGTVVVSSSQVFTVGLRESGTVQ